MENLKFISVLLVVALFSCDKKESINDGSVLFAPTPTVFIGDTTVHLQWSDVIYIEFDDNIHAQKVIPDVLGIFVSDEPNDQKAKSVSEVSFNEKSYTLNSLANGKPIYIYLLAKKKGYKSQKSGMIMVVPNKRKEYECILQGAENQYFWDLAVSPDGTKITYVDNYEWGNGNYSAMSLFLANIDGTNAQMIAKSSYKPSWSPDGTKIAFRAEDNEINGGNAYPAQIAIYDCNTKAITRLTSGAYYKYRPSFSDDGNYLAYQTDEDLLNSGNSSNIFTLNIQTLEKKQYSTTKGIYEFPTEYFGHFLVSGKIASVQNIIGLCSSSGVSGLIEIFRNDYRPSLSPDKKRVAFVSDRSGMQQIWVYEIETHKFTQVTGYDENEYVYDYAWTKVNWIDDSTLVFTMNHNKVLRQKI